MLRFNSAVPFKFNIPSEPILVFLKKLSSPKRDNISRLEHRYPQLIKQHLNLFKQV